MACQTLPSPRPSCPHTLHVGPSALPRSTGFHLQPLGGSAAPGMRESKSQRNLPTLLQLLGVSQDLSPPPHLSPPALSPF